MASGCPETGRGLSQLVISPRIAQLTDGKSLLTAATSEQMPKEALDRLKLCCLFKVVQLERWVLLTRNGGRDGDDPDFPSSMSEQASNVVLLRKDHDLKERILSLFHKNCDLVAANKEFAAKLELIVSSWDIFKDRTTTHQARPITSSPSYVR